MPSNANLKLRLWGALILGALALLALAAGPGRAQAQSVERVALLHPDNHSELMEIEEGAIVDLADLGMTDPVVVAETIGPVDRVTWTLVDVLRERTRHAGSWRQPWSMCGHWQGRRVEYLSCRWISRPGPYLLRVEPVTSGSPERLAALTLSFEVVGAPRGAGRTGPSAGAGRTGPSAGAGRTGPSAVRCVEGDCASFDAYFDDENYDPVRGNRCTPGRPGTYRQPYIQYGQPGGAARFSLEVTCP